MTAADVLLTFATYYPDCAGTTPQSLFNTANREILDRANLRLTQVTINLVAGTREYDLVGTNLRVQTANYIQASGDWYALLSTSTDWLDFNLPGWRNNPNQVQPTRFYVSSVDDGSGGSKQVLGTDWLPDTTTTGGYPIIILTTEQESSLSGTDTLPDALLSEMAHVYRMCELWSARNDRTNTQGWHQLYSSELDKQVEHVKNLAPNTLTSLQLARSYQMGRMY